MKQIWKFPLTVQGVSLDSHGSHDIVMPMGSQILSAGPQFYGLVLWALCDPDMPDTTIKIRVVFTGEPISQTNLIFIQSIQVGEIVYHVFEDLGDDTKKN
tara:strand:- start:649 stop:948 length:300 start_codon:yes stop_codon:yes gene_type:complete